MVRFQSPTEYPPQAGTGAAGEGCSAARRPGPLPWLHLCGSSGLSGSALPGSSALTSFSPNLPASSTNSAQTADAEGSPMRVSKQSSREREVLPCHLRWAQGRPRGLSYRRQEAEGGSSESRSSAGRRQGVATAGMQQAVSLSPGLGGVKSKSYLTDGRTTSHFPHSPRTPLPALKLHTQNTQ